MKMRWLIIALLCSPAFGATVFVSQNGGSVACGADGTQTTVSRATFNSSQVAGNTYKLCGTFTSNLTLQNNGSAGNVITLFWESNAVLQAATCWGTLGSSAVAINGHSFWVFDGNGTNPSVTASSCGSGLGQTDSNAFGSTSTCSNDEFKNLTITNIYVHNSVSDTSGGPGSGISCSGGSHILIHDNSFDQMFVGFDDAYQNGDTDVQFYKNTVDHFNWGVHIGNNSTASITGILLHDNHLKNMSNWDTTIDAYHHDGLFVVQNNTSANITGTQIYNNLADGAMSVPANCGGNTCATAWIFFNTGIHGFYVYNNVLIGDGSSFLTEGGITGDTDFEFYNNYFKCSGSAIGGGLLANFSNVSTFKFENNAVDNCSTGSTPFTFSNVTSQTFDYNDYKGWTSGETHSLNSANLSVSSLGVPTAGSPLLHNLSTQWLNLTTTCSTISGLCSDFNGVSRPNTAFAWDAGAYQGASVTFSALPSTLPANHSANMTVTLTGSGTSWTGSTAFAVSGVTGAVIISCSNSSATSETCQIRTGVGTGTLTITDTTDSISTTVTVATATLSVSPSLVGVGKTPTVTLTGGNTLWSSETAAGLFSVSGGTGSSIGTPTVTSNTSATATLTVGSSAGTETITDNSTTATGTTTAAFAVAPTCDHITGTYTGSFSNKCSTTSAAPVILCWSTSTTPVTNGLGTGCSVGTVLLNNGSTTISASEVFNIVAGTSSLPDSAVTIYTYIVTSGPTGGGISGGAQISNGAVIR